MVQLQNKVVTYVMFVYLFDQDALQIAYVAGAKQVRTKTTIPCFTTLAYASVCQLWAERTIWLGCSLLRGRLLGMRSTCARSRLKSTPCFERQM